MRRFFATAGACSLVLLYGCVSDSLAPGTSGSISLDLVVPGPAASAAASGAARSQPLQSIRVTVDGPTPKSATFQCAATCDGTIDGLSPGSYAVVVEGLIGTEVDHFGQTSGVNVVAGANSTATINFQSFRPVLTAFPDDTTEVLRFTVAFGAVPTATGYRVEYAQSADFSGATSTTITATSTEIVVTEEAQYFVRVRATNDVVTTGRWSDAQAIVALQGVAAVTVSPGTPTIVDGATQPFTAEGRDGDNNVVSGITFFWSSSDHRVVTVNQAGLATATGIGTATITAVGKGQPGSASVTVTFGPPAAFAFVASPPRAEPDGPFGAVVDIVDARGNRTNATSNVTLALGNNPGGGTLAGTLTVAAVNGRATFAGLSIDVSADGYTLAASGGSLPNHSSTAFDVFLDFVQVRIGPATPFACGVTVTGSAYCWGFNDAGLGDGGGGMGARPFPHRVAGGHTFVSVHPGGLFNVVGFTCGLRTDGAALCWGTNTQGQLGDGTMTASPTPVLVTGGHTFSSLSTGVAHACGVRASDAAVLCWGAGANGRLGNGGTTDSPTPVVVSGSHTFTMVDAGSLHTCGVRATDNAALCWGFGNNGQLGAGGTIGAIPDALTPVVVTTGGPYASVTAGGNHSCAIRTDGLARCWGLGTSGQLGDGANTTSSVSVSVSHGQRFANLSAGANHTCGASPSGEAWCWGGNTGGQLGNGVIGTSSAVPVPVVGARSWTMVHASQFTSVGLANDGGFVWGNGTNGERGDGTTTPPNIPFPTRVLGSR